MGEPFQCPTCGSGDPETYLDGCRDAWHADPEVRRIAADLLDGEDDE